MAEQVEASCRIPRMTLSWAVCDASKAGVDLAAWRNEIRACAACGEPFRPKRQAQMQCSHRCRQRSYVQRRAMTTLGYYGA